MTDIFNIQNFSKMFQERTKQREQCCDCSRTTQRERDGKMRCLTWAALEVFKSTDQKYSVCDVKSDKEHFVSHLSGFKADTGAYK